jgi:hypothetical protein
MAVLSGRTRTVVALLAGVSVGMVVGPTSAVVQPAPQIVEIPAPVDVTIRCDAAIRSDPWAGELEPLEGRADCTIQLLEAVGWDVNVATIGVVNDYSDVRFGGPCGALAHFRETKRW